MIGVAEKGVSGRRTLAWMAIAGYVLAVHAALLAIVFDPSLAERVRARLLPRPDHWTPSEFWQEMLAYHLRLDPTAEGGVLFFGDSITQSLDVGALAAHAVNYGIGGDTIVGMSRRLPLYRSLGAARAMVMAIGVNDLVFNDAQRAESAYGALLQEIPPSVPLVLSAVLPIDERALKERPSHRTNEEIARLDHTIERLCAARTGCVFVDAGPALRNEDGNLAARFHVGDGIHLNVAGYRVWMDALARSLAVFAPKGS